MNPQIGVSDGRTRPDLSPGANPSTRLKPPMSDRLFCDLDLFLVHEYPDWLEMQYRLQYPLLFGAITATPIAIFDGEATSGALTIVDGQSYFFIGEGNGDVLRLKISSNTLQQISRKPKPTYDCGRVKKVKVRHNGNVVIAWEKCLLEEKGRHRKTPPTLVNLLIL